MTDSQEKGVHCELIVGVQVVMEVWIWIGLGWDGCAGYWLSKNFDLCDLTDEGQVGDGGALMVMGGMITGEGMNMRGESDAHSVMFISAR